MNNSVTVTLTALWQIQQMLIIPPSVLRWIRPDLSLLAGGISSYWRRKTGVSPGNWLTPFIPVPALFTEHGQLTWQLRIPTPSSPSSSCRAAPLYATVFKICPLSNVALFVGENVRPLLPCFVLFFLFERWKCLATFFYCRMWEVPLIDPQMLEMSGCNLKIFNTESIYFLHVCVFLFVLHREDQNLYLKVRSLLWSEEFLSGPQNFAGVCEG